MATTISRVPAHTKEKYNRRIERDLQARLEYYKSHPDEIGERLQELNEEWDIERSLEANAATISVVSIVLGLTVNRKWLIFPGVVGGFLFQHAVQGWCPPLPVFRRLGVRTQPEIERERYALQSILNKTQAKS